MDSQLTVDVTHPASTGSGNTLSIYTGSSQSNMSPMPSVHHRRIPLAVDKDQLIYWTYRWHSGEQQTRKAFSQGQGRTFATAEEAILWLLSDDE